MSDTAHNQAIVQIESIGAMVASVNVDYGRLEELRSSSRFVAGWNMLEPEDVEELEELEEAAGDCESQDEALERIQDHPLSIEYRSGWASPGEELTREEFRIVLCTGGPHVELVGDVDGSRIRVLYKDWGGSGELFDFDRDAVAQYVAYFVGE